MSISQPIYDDMLVPLLAACSSYKGRWVRLLSKLQEEDRVPLYLALSDYCEHLIVLLSTGEQQQVADVFAAIEQLLTSSDDYIQAAAIVGMIESLQDIRLHNSTLPTQFYPFLGQTSKIIWDELWTSAVKRLSEVQSEIDAVLGTPENDASSGWNL